MRNDSSTVSDWGGNGSGAGGEEHACDLAGRGCRFWFYEADLLEPAHVHVGKHGGEAKYWIDPVRLARSRGFQKEELSEIERIIAEHRNDILAAWRKEQEKRGHGQS